MKIDWITVLCGVGALSVGVDVAQMELAFYSRSTVTVGEVVKLNSGAYHPQISFTTRDSETISFPAGTFSPVEVGDRLEVRYERDRPRATATIDSTFGLFGAPLVLSIAGLALFIYGLRGKSLLDLVKRK